MSIRLITHDLKKKLMRSFYIAYRGILSRGELFATGAAGRLTEEVTSLNVHEYLAGHLGEGWQPGVDIEQNQLDLVTFLRELLVPRCMDPDSGNIIRLCDIHNIPSATNLATTELLIKAFDRGDLEWCGMYKQKLL